MQFNWVDFVIIITLLIFIFDAIGRPLISELFDFLSFLTAFILSFVFYNIPGTFFENAFGIPHGLALVLGFVTIWFLSETTFFIIARLIYPYLIKMKIKIPGEKFLAVIPAILRSLIFIALFLVLTATFPIQPAIKKSVQDSHIGSYILKNAYGLETPVKNVFGGVSNDTLTFLTIKPKTDERVDLGFRTRDYRPDDTIENQMIELVNDERTSRGLKPLVFDENLREIGRSHSADMFAKGYFSHFDPEGKSVADRVNEANIEYQVVGENLAYAPSLELAHKGLMNSPGHRANILSEDYAKIGIGVMDGGVYGLMFTQVFSN